MSERFWSKTTDDGECVIWVAGKDHNGYGQVWWAGMSRPAHRVAFFLRTGRWPEADLRHLCNRPECVLHGVEGTRSENTLDMVAAGTHNMARKTHCKRNHEFTPENTRHRNGRRDCMTCVRDRDRAAQRARRAAA